MNEPAAQRCDYGNTSPDHAIREEHAMLRLEEAQVLGGHDGLLDQDTAAVASGICATTIVCDR
jgi:hypothetical protein